MRAPKLPKAVIDRIVPANLGIDISKDSTSIDQRSALDIANYRFRYKQITQRAGYQMKYGGLKEPALIIDAAYDVSNNQYLVAVTRRGIYAYDSGNRKKFVPIDICGDGTSCTSPNLGLNLAPWSGDFINLDVGLGQYKFGVANGGATYPTTGYGTIMVICSNNAGPGAAMTSGSTLAPGFLILAATGISSTYHPSGVVQAEVINGGAFANTDPRYSSPFPFVRAVSIYDWRIVSGGVQGALAYIEWSGQGNFNQWNPTILAGAGGNQMIGEGPDLVEALHRLGEYLVAYKDRSIYLGRKTGQTGASVFTGLAAGGGQNVIGPFVFSPFPVAGIGISAPLTLDDAGGDAHIFLGWDNVYLLTLSSVDPIANNIVDELFYGGSEGILPAYITQCKGRVAEEFNEYWLYIPTGRIPDADGIGTPWWNYLSQVGNPGVSAYGNPLFVDYSTTDLATVPAGWANYLTGTGAGTYATYNLSGTNDSILAGSVCAFTKTAGAAGDNVGFKMNVNYNNNAVSLLNSTHSVMLWMKAAVASTPVMVDIVGLRADGVTQNEIYTATFNVGTAYAPYALNYKFTVGGVNPTTQVLIRVYTQTSGVQIKVIGVQPMDITTRLGMSTQFLVDIQDQGGFRPNDGTRALVPAYKDALDGLTMCPFICDNIGPWMCDTVWVYNFDDQSWTRWRLPSFGSGYDVTSQTITIAQLQGTVAQQFWRFGDRLLSALSPSNLIGGMGGEVFEVGVAYLNDYAHLPSAYQKPILSYWISKDFDLQQPLIDKTLSRLVIHHNIIETSQPPSVEVDVSTDGGNTWTSQTVPFKTNSPETYVDFFVTGPQVRFKVQTNGASIPIDGFTIKLIPRGESNVY